MRVLAEVRPLSHARLRVPSRGSRPGLVKLMVKADMQLLEDERSERRGPHWIDHQAASARGMLFGVPSQARGALWRDRRAGNQPQRDGGHWRTDRSSRGNSPLPNRRTLWQPHMGSVGGSACPRSAADMPSRTSLTRTPDQNRVSTPEARMASRIRIVPSPVVVAV
jgi:hypothetical protein